MHTELGNKSVDVCEAKLNFVFVLQRTAVNVVDIGHVTDM